MSCLSDENLAAWVSGSASDKPLSAWHDHIATCDSCAAKAMRRQAGVHNDRGDGSAPTDGDAEPPDPDATITVGTETDLTQQGIAVAMRCEE